MNDVEYQLCISSIYCNLKLTERKQNLQGLISSSLIMSVSETPNLPIAISYIHDRYLLFDINVATYLRREHNIPGVLTGSLPQIPQQNVFLGLPLELMPEEVKVLADKGVAYVVDDVARHQNPSAVEEEDRSTYLENLQRQGDQVARIKANEKEERKEKALNKVGKSLSGNDSARPSKANADNQVKYDDSLLERPQSSQSSLVRPSHEFLSIAVTPATSDTLMPPRQNTNHNIKVPKSFPLFAYLHSKGYFISPGLRFGCQYMAYPGDPLRFHSHFLGNGYDWDEDIDLMDLLGGGRLGTGVKKGFLIGGKGEGSDEENPSMPSQVRAWSLEWAGL